jgi:hypothetical protein
MLFPLSACHVRDVQPSGRFGKLSCTSTALVGATLFGLTLLITSCGFSSQGPHSQTTNPALSASASRFKSPIFSSMKENEDEKSLLHVMVSSDLPPAIVGISYNAAISAEGGTRPDHFLIIAGALPTGLSLNPATGNISGTALIVGTSRFVVYVTDATGNDLGLQSLSLSVTPAGSPGGGSPVSVQVSPASVSLGSGDSEQFSATVRETSNVAVIWSASAGTISPTGLFQAPAVTSVNTATVIVTSVADASKRASAIVTIAPATSPAPGPVITSGALPPAQVGTPYRATLAATGGQAPYRWTASSGLPAGLALDTPSGTISGATSQPGTFSFTAQVTDSNSQSNSKGLSLSVSASGPPPSGFDGPAELPRVYLNTTLADTPAPGATISVNAGGDLQAALNSANCGDTVQLQAGASFSGRFTLPAKTCDDQHWILIRSSASDSALPPEGTRVTPCYAGLAELPGRPALNCASTQNVLAQVSYPQPSGSGPIVLAAGANHYRLLGLEITRALGTGYVGALVSVQGSAAADDLVLDRVWLHGTAQDETGRGVYLNGLTYFSVVDSYFSDFHCISAAGACTDAQAIVGGSGDSPGGPYKIVDNFLEASSEGILLGGGPATTTAADIEIRRNHFFKPRQWMPGASGFVGGPKGNPFVVKNHFELKNAQRVLFEGNVLENTWGGFSQHGFSILLTPKNQHTPDGSNVCPICQVTDVTIRYNTISHAGAGISIATAISGDGSNGAMALAGARYSIHDITIDDVDSALYKGSGTLIQIFNAWSKNVLNSIAINHITGLGDPNGHLLTLTNNMQNPPMWGLTFTNNIVATGRYPVWSAGGGQATCAYFDLPLKSLTACFSTYIFDTNALLALPSAFPPSTWPTGNFFAPDLQTAQFVNYNDGKNGDYHLLPSSPYKNAGTDGKDLGADIDSLYGAISGVN